MFNELFYKLHEINLDEFEFNVNDVMEFLFEGRVKDGFC